MHCKVPNVRLINVNSEVPSVTSVCPFDDFVITIKNIFTETQNGAKHIRAIVLLGRSINFPFFVIYQTFGFLA